MAISFDELKDRLRAAYIHYRRGKIPNYRGGEDLENSLDTGARNCIAAKITPEDYCMALYQVYASDKVDNFWPNQLRGTKALEIAKKYVANFERISYKQLWNTQLGLLKQALDRTQRSVEDVLYDHALPFSAWFRVVATVDPVPKIIERYGKEARAELTDELVAFLKGVAPQNLPRLQSL